MRNKQMDEICVVCEVNYRKDKKNANTIAPPPNKQDTPKIETQPLQIIQEQQPIIKQAATTQSQPKEQNQNETSKTNFYENQAAYKDENQSNLMGTDISKKEAGNILRQKKLYLVSLLENETSIDGIDKIVGLLDKLQTLCDKLKF
ncbi:UNKNOWN [Stylonychia lemnae]|uniref:Uncharacterized protein n=1 Tax=Stylonychia lemnae TaxID=5949 RepID=A0A078AL45_STYLE|nr:UNKNOWN [Stylonychia lemnae]|eukprot:CDW82601.1 UNKNOWN [Stylonychia lemnae]